jgi:acetylornithine deacetylase/succinyl-diaminopimelate desuccinylase-like protein
MGTLSARAFDDAAMKVAQDPAVTRGLDWLGKNTGWLTEQQIRLTEIPAPEFNEAQRGAALKQLFEAAGLDVHVDDLGNVIGERPGTDPKGVILLAAHLDTVFPTGTDVHVKRSGTRLLAPGISDNSAGLSALAGVARALAESRVRTTKTIVLAGDVGEEGEGNLRGMRALVEHYGSRLSAVIAVDGPSTEHITTQGIASRRVEVTITGPGGHSWSDFGAPNPITALSRGIVRFSSIRLPDTPRSSFNFGVIEGGQSVNSIPARASVKVDLRSESEDQLTRMENSLREAMQLGARDESFAARSNKDAVQISFRSIGTRPAGSVSEDSALVQAIRDADRFLGNRSRLERSSTDANVPLSMGIPAVAVGGGGSGGGAHTLNEWYDSAGRELGVKRLFLAAITLAGIQP